jgi:hypothetical protein
MGCRGAGQEFACMLGVSHGYAEWVSGMGRQEDVVGGTWRRGRRVARLGKQGGDPETRGGTGCGGLGKGVASVHVVQGGFMEGMRGCGWADGAWCGATAAGGCVGGNTTCWVDGVRVFCMEEAGADVRRRYLWALGGGEVAQCQGAGVRVRVWRLGAPAPGGQGHGCIVSSVV